jgi:hypothetical protein
MAMRPASVPDWRDFEIEQTGEDGGHCDCCGDTTKRVWGFVRYCGEPFGAYFLGWTVGKPDHGAAFDLILGDFDEDAPSTSRFAISLDYRIVEGSGSFMVVDAESRIPVEATNALFGKALKRTDIVGTELASEVFGVVDAIYLSSSGDELRRWADGQQGT